jgi:diguanylate cyclase (GGDEF)-like protein/PAS domain S-box-containing protein
VTVQDWFRSAPCGLVATTVDGEIVDANPTFLSWTGYPLDAVVGRPFAALLDPGSKLFFETRHSQIMHLRGEVHEVALTLVKADGTTMPSLINSTRDDDAGIIRTAVFNAAERIRYERELVTARRAAETSEERVRILQDVSTAFGVSATDEDVAESFASVARTAFAARETAVLLIQEDGELELVGGTNPLAGKVSPVPELRKTLDVAVVTAGPEERDFPQVAEALRAERLASLTVTPLVADGVRLGILVCFFARRTEFDTQFFDLLEALGRQASQTLTRVRLQRRLAFLALHDQMTGVANRQMLQLTLDDAITHASDTGEPLAVMFLDVDDFKSINDAFDHATGDLVLVELATRLQTGVRSGDVVGRIGGDEFVAVCAGTDAEAAASIAARILDICGQPVVVADGIVSPSVSIGISLYRPGVDSPPTPEQLLVRADAAMYDSKRQGKNRHSFNEA